MGDDLFDKFGLPKELNLGESIFKEGQKITVKIEKKKFGKKYTVIQGIDTRDLDIKEITKRLKEKFACGGTCKDNVIELQGDHVSKTKKVLIELDFPAESIEVINDE
jgi:translation initiation factor 1